VYGVADRIEFIHGDFTALAPRLRADVVFLSPPWGGPGYQSAAEFDVATMMGGLDGFELLRLALAISPHVAYYLPRNTARAQLAAMPAMQAGEYAFETERCVLNGRLKALIAYFGELPANETGPHLIE
jgi:trimethylguanosine synthase